MSDPKYTKGLNNIDLVYYINLDHRKDRLEHITNELKKTNIDENKIHRIKAVHIPDFGPLGCSKSHVNVLETFINSDESNKTCLILEDDFIFSKNQDTINDLLNKVFENIDNFDVVMFSSNTFAGKKSEYDFAIKIFDAQTTSGYMVNRNFSKTLLQNYKEGVSLLESCNHRDRNLYIDMYMKKLQPISNWYCLEPTIGKQIESYSDIEKRITNYNC